MASQDNTRTAKQRDGDTAEALAVAHLEQAGLQIIERNFRVRGGEIDCVARDKNMLIFVEVRYRQHQQFGGAAGSINLHKQQRIIHAAQLYLLKHPRFADVPCRFDCILLDQLQSAQIEWIKDAFQLN